MTHLLNNYKLFSGLFISDPKVEDFTTLQREMRDIRLLPFEKLETRLEQTLYEIDHLGPEKLGKMPVEGLIRGACFAACLMKTRARFEKRSGRVLSRLFGNSAMIKACEKLLDKLSDHPLAPDCVKNANFAHKSFASELSHISEFYQQERALKEQMAHLRDLQAVGASRSTRKVAYLPI